MVLPTGRLCGRHRQAGRGPDRDGSSESGQERPRAALRLHRISLRPQRQMQKALTRAQTR
eukprot:359768-Chlamydomonas_euryale.AAC.9